MNKYLLFAIMMTSISCYAQKKVLDSWLGHPQSELIRSWGPPKRTTSDGNGGIILIYEKYILLSQGTGVYQYQNNSIVVPGQDNQLYYTEPGQVIYTPPTENGYWRRRMFYVNSQNNIYTWRSEGM